MSDIMYLISAKILTMFLKNVLVTLRGIPGYAWTCLVWVLSKQKCEGRTFISGFIFATLVILLWTVAHPDHQVEAETWPGGMCVCVFWAHVLQSDLFKPDSTSVLFALVKMLNLTSCIVMPWLINVMLQFVTEAFLKHATSFLKHLRQIKPNDYSI